MAGRNTAESDDESTEGVEVTGQTWKVNPGALWFIEETRATKFSGPALRIVRPLRLVWNDHEEVWEYPAGK